MYTYQDFEKDYARSASDAIMTAISQHKKTDIYKNAVTADKYDRQQNETILNVVKFIYDMTGRKAVDELASNHKICCNLFNRLNTQRMTYSLGNGITFDKSGIKETLGGDIDTKLRDAGYYSLIHGESFLFYNNGTVELFKITGFVPIIDEISGIIRAGVRFWQIDSGKPLVAILYEESGYTRFESGEDKRLSVTVEKRPYRQVRTTTGADEYAGNPPDVSEDNYGGALPIVPLWGSRLHQSTIVGIRSKIDVYDLVQSGFANDMSDCAEIYWVVSGAGGATDSDLSRFRDRVKLNHIASVQDADVTVTPYTQEIPYMARKELLDNIRSSIYEDFGGLDVHTIAAGATNDHIDAAYQPMDENADDFEYQIIIAVQALLKLAGVTEQVPKFKRNRISNQREAAEIVLMFAQYLSDDMIRSKAPFLSADEIQAENEKAIADDERRFEDVKDEPVEPEGGE